MRCLVEPSGILLEVNQGETILAAARRARVEWETACDGAAECADCVIAVVEGVLSPARPDEADALQWDRRKPEERLACQAKVITDVVVRREELR